MSATEYLKLQLSDFVEVYKKNYYKTIGTTIIGTLITFTIVAILLKYSHFYLRSANKQYSLLSFLFARYSAAYVYSIVDLSKTVFLFIVSLFSVALVKLQAFKTDKKDFHFNNFLSQIKISDVAILLIAFLTSCISDYVLIKINYFTSSRIGSTETGKWLFGTIFYFRIYIPLLIFACANYSALYRERIKFSFKKLIMLLFTLWICNVFAYEFAVFIRNYVFGLFLLPFPVEKYFIIESLLDISLVSFLFLCYHSAMTNSMRLLNGNTLYPLL